MCRKRKNFSRLILAGPASENAGPTMLDARAGKVNNRVRMVVWKRIQLAESGEWKQLVADLLIRTSSSSASGGIGF